MLTVITNFFGFIKLFKPHVTFNWHITFNWNLLMISTLVTGQSALNYYICVIYLTLASSLLRI